MTKREILTLLEDVKDYLEAPANQPDGQIASEAMDHVVMHTRTVDAIDDLKKDLRRSRRR